MSEKNLIIAKAYYLALNNKNLSEVEQYLHPHIQFISPFANIEGKEAMINAVKGFMTIVKKLTIRTECGSGDQVMLVYDLESPEPIGSSRAAVLMNFKDGLIARFELFFDARPFERKA
jgi:hypothetical protein